MIPSTIYPSCSASSATTCVFLPITSSQADDDSDKHDLQRDAARERRKQIVGNDVQYHLIQFGILTAVLRVPDLQAEKRQTDQRNQHRHDNQIQKVSDAYASAYLAESGCIPDAVYSPDNRKEDHRTGNCVQEPEESLKERRNNILPQYR